MSWNKWEMVRQKVKVSSKYLDRYQYRELRRVNLGEMLSMLNLGDLWCPTGGV